MTVTQRPPAELRIDNRARMAAAAQKRHERKAAQATERAEVERTYLASLHVDACERFDLDLPLDPVLLDVLESIDVAPANRWLWRGVRNNKGLATVRLWDDGPHELSVVRFLAIRLGVISPDEHGSLYPVEGDTEDVNPFHRDLRRSAQPMGNVNRFTPGGGEGVTYRFAIQDPMNPWALAIEVEAVDPDQARRLAESYLFARRPVGESLVHINQENP